jgi:hypothetical protein
LYVDLKAENGMGRAGEGGGERTVNGEREQEDGGITSKVRELC